VLLGDVDGAWAAPRLLSGDRCSYGTLVPLFMGCLVSLDGAHRPAQRQRSEGESEWSGSGAQGAPPLSHCSPATTGMGWWPGPSPLRCKMRWAKPPPELARPGQFQQARISYASAGTQQAALRPLGYAMGLV